MRAMSGRRLKMKTVIDTDRLVGERVRLRRSMQRMSQQYLAEKVGLTFQQLQKYERGTNRVSASRLYDLARELSVPIAFFFQKGDPAHAPPLADAVLSEADDPLLRADSQALVAAYRALAGDQLREAFVRLLQRLVEAEATPPAKRKRRVA